MTQTVAVGRPRVAPQVPEATDATGLLLELFDPGTGRIAGGGEDTGVVVGQGRANGCPIEAYATDRTRRGGALSNSGCLRIASTIDRARERGVPVVGVWHSGGAALQEGVASLDGVSRMFRAMVAASGKVPQISVVVGPAAGGAAYGPALTDLVVMSRDARVFVTGPDVIRGATGEDVTADDLGGPRVHGRHSGVAHVTVETRADAMAAGRRLASLLGDQGHFADGRVGPGRDVGSVLPESSRRAYDVLPLVDAILDAPGAVLHSRWAPNVQTVIGRLAGRTVGVVANNPLRRGGCLDALAGDKAARFVRMCDAFGVPLVVLVDVPGYLPGLGQERDAVVRRGAKLLHAFAGASIPRVTLITRKAFGGAFIAMNSRGLGATAVYAWPSAEIGIMNAANAVAILHRRELAACPDEDRAGLHEHLTETYTAGAGGLDRAIELGALDAVIEPRDTRAALVAGLSAGTAARGDQLNVPL